MMNYYDGVLVLIPLSLVGSAIALYGLGVSMTTAAPLGAAVAIGVMGHAMFVNAPGAAPAQAESSPERSAE